MWISSARSLSLSVSSLWISSKERSYKMRQSFKTVQCSLQWCTGVCVGIILPAVQKGEGGVPYYTPYFLTEEKNQSVLMNNIQNSQKDLNSIHLRYCQGSGPEWLKTWLQKGISIQLLEKIGLDLTRGQFISVESSHWTTSSHWNKRDLGRAESCFFLLVPGDDAKQLHGWVLVILLFFFFFSLQMKEC